MDHILCKFTVAYSTFYYGADKVVFILRNKIYLCQFFSDTHQQVPVFESRRT